MNKRLLACFLSIVLLVVEMPVTVLAYEKADEVCAAEELRNTNEEEFMVDASPYVLQEGGLLAPETIERENLVSAGDDNLSSTYGTDQGQNGVVTDNKYLTTPNYVGAEAAICAALDSCASECDVSAYNIPSDDVSSFYWGILNSHPEYFYVSSAYTRWSSGGYCTKIGINYSYSLEEAAGMKAEYNAKIDDILSEVSASWSEFEKVLFINDYLCRNCAYDTTYTKYDAYNCIVKGSAVCQGYALAFKALCNELNVECNLVTSSELNHAWNMVKVNSKYYLIDSTWNDPLADRPGRARHFYFLKSDSYFQNPDIDTSHAASDWVINGGWQESYCDDTYYDDYFWNSYDTGFDYIDGYWYNFDGASAVEQFTCDGTDMSRVKAVVSVSDTWPVWGEQGYIWNGKYVGVAACENRIYYNDKSNVYCYDPLTDTVSVYYTLSDELASQGYIYGLTIGADGSLNISISRSPNETGTNYTIAYLKQGSFNIYYVLNEGTNNAQNPSKISAGDPAVTLMEPTKTGYAFEGWYSDSDYTQRVTTISGDIGSDITLYAKWTIETYTISYELNGGVNNGGNVFSYTVENSFTFRNPTKSGYTFAGWYTDSNFDSASRVYKIEKGTTGNIRLYAKWSENIYYIDYVTYGGENDSQNPTSISAGEASIELKAATREGYNFEGWYTDEAFNNKITEISNTITDDITLYAKWSIIYYDISYNLNGGTNSSENPASYNIEEEVTLLEPTRVGYTFAGWYTDSIFEESSRISNIAKGQVGNKILYAKWILKKFKVEYVLNGGNNPSEAVCEYDITTSKTLLPVPTRPGYTFGGWYLDSECRTSRLLEISGSLGTDLLLYSKWNTNVYLVNVDLAGGTCDETIITDFTIDTPAYLLPTPERRGFEFEGWYRDEDMEMSVSEIAGGMIGDVNLTARWKPVDYSIHYELNGGTNSEDNPDTYTILDSDISLSDPELEDYVFAGWYLDRECTKSFVGIPSGSVGEITVYAKWVEGSYGVKYILNGGVNNPSNITYYEYLKKNFTLKKPTRTGYTFAGWYSTPDFQKNTKVTYIKKGAAVNTILYAKWTPVKYTISYDYAGGKKDINAATNPKNYTVESGTITLSEPLRKGYTFLGWYDNKGKGVKVEEIATGSRTGSIKLKAKWSKDTHYITFDVMTEDDVNNPNVKPEYYDMETGLYTKPYYVTTSTQKLKNPTRKGYTFKGWYTGCEEKVDRETGESFLEYTGKISQIKKGDIKDYTLYAKWVLNEYSITYKIGGKKVKDLEPDSYNILSGTITLPVPEKEGYTFSGWYTSSKYKGSPLTELDFKNKNITLYGKWIKNK